MDLDWIGLLELLTLIQLLLLTAVILNYKKGKSLSNLLLAALWHPMHSSLPILSHYMPAGRPPGIVSVSTASEVHSISPDAFFVFVYPIPLL